GGRPRGGAGGVGGGPAPEHPDLSAVVSGELVATLALPRAGTPAGVAAAVPAGAVAALVIGLDGDRLVAARSAPPGVALRNQGDLPIADRDLRAGEVSVLAEGAAAAAAFERAFREWQVVAAAWLAGLADGALALATAWVKERTQFGVPIGSFQGVQHGLADLPGKVDGAVLLAREAGWALDGDRVSLTGASGAELPAMALLFAAGAARDAAGRAVQYHGGLGVSIEHDAQLFLRRAQAYPLLAGSPRHLLRDLGAQLVAAAPTATIGTVSVSEDGGPGDFGHSPAVGALATEVRSFTAEALTDDIRHEMHRTGTIHVPEVTRAMAGRGWLGNADADRRDPQELAALFRELELAEAPYHGMATTMIVAGVLERMARPELKATALPRLLSGETIAVLGYSEPENGSDVANARTRAEPVHDEPGGPVVAWRINGQKMWTTLAHKAGYAFLLTRTATDRPKHRGLTMFLLPMDTPGITIQPIHTIADERTNIVFFDDVVIPDLYRIGEVNEGWQVMAVGLSMERGVMGGTGMLEPLAHAAAVWAARPGPDGVRPADDPDVLAAVAAVRVDAEVALLLTQRTADLAATGASPAVSGTMAKLFASTAYQHHARELQQVAGVAGILRGGPSLLDPPGGEPAPASVLAPAAGGEIERLSRHCAVLTIQGGTTEIARNLVAEQRLGLPKTRPGTRSASNGAAQGSQAPVGARA
ncbi:MAG: acyl-CoA dehydrogenase family protein, partial [Frankia sp.]|nr:acyl-CoA dehydrogenase family protein [Frankia sp.]